MTINKLPYIVDIKRNSLDDGPGIRTVIFFKGCPLSCVWCQNPETKNSNQEISFEKEKCAECHKCIEKCSFDAIDYASEYRIDRTKCNLCGECIPICPNQAIKLVGKIYTIEDLVSLLLKDRIFYKNSGGGITLSGGEPTFHINYLNELLVELKKENLHICLETCGYFNLDQFKSKILPYLDLIYFDLKIFDSELHKEYCGVTNGLILKNLENLLKNSTVEILPRIPLIPQITATNENLTQLRDYLLSLNQKKIELLPYNPLWHSKAEAIGATSQVDCKEWMIKEELTTIKSIFSDFEISGL